MLNKLTWLAFCTIISGAVFAQDKLYTTIGIGWAFPTQNSNTITDSGFAHFGPTAAPSGNSFFNLPNVDWVNSFQNGFNLNAAIGYNLYPSVRGDIEFIYQRFKRNITGSYGWAEYDVASAALQSSVSGIIMTPTSSYTSLYTILTNGYYDFHNNSKWTPLLGAGFGIAWVQSSATTANGSFRAPGSVTATPTRQYSQSLSGTAFAWQLKAGIAYEYSKNVAIVTQYRFFATTRFIANQSSITTNPSAGPTTTRVFRVPQQSIRGFVTNAIEVQLKFKL